MKRFKSLQFILALWLGLTVFAFAQAAEDLFAGIKEKPEEEKLSEDFFTDNFGFRKELMSEFSARNDNVFSSRQSVGFEVLKKFSSETSTFAALDFQGRLVRRDGSLFALNDMEGMDRLGWFFEYHNAYVDFYNLFGEIGRFNFRIGRFYLPFGLNLQTDTHGSILQLSNEMNFGFERDWLAGFSGFLTKGLNYDAYYLAGSGYGLSFEGQGGLGTARISLSNQASSEEGLEGGLSLMGGRRLSAGTLVDTTRFGMDLRLRKPIGAGLLTWANELSAGEDNSTGLFNQLHQIDFLHESRRWGLAAQFRRFWRNIPAVSGSAESSLLTEATWYFRNDVGNSNLQWIKLNLEWKTEGKVVGQNLLLTAQYYQYW